MASYRSAVEWIAGNDDVDLGGPETPLVSICMVADLWNKDTSVVLADVVRKRKKMEKADAL